MPSSLNKAHGAAAEMLVVHELLRKGFGVALPLGDTEPYDIIATRGSGIWRLQVKATETRVRGNYRVIFRHGAKNKKAYTPEDCDFIITVVYYSERPGIYVIPLEEIDSVRGVFWEVGQHSRYPEAWPRCRWEVYRDAWDLLV